MGVRSQIAAGALGVGAGALPIPGGIEGIPQRALQAYITAAQSTDACPGMRWSVIAAIYRKESGHGSHGGATIGGDGVVSPAIYGPPVDWMGGARAEGPGQFMPSSWRLYGQGNPQDIDDAAAATVRHLCGTYGDVNGDHLRGAIVSYYGADQDGYADDVLADIATYDRAAPYLVEDREGKERTPERAGRKLWNVTLRGWVRAGDAAELVHLDWVWDDADDWLFGADQTVSSGPLPARADGLDPTFGAKLDAMIAAAPGTITVSSGLRTAGEQLDLWNRYQDGTGNPAFWSDGVSCESKHCAGLAADLRFDGASEAWAHENAARFGLVFPYGHEPWHVELAG